MSIGIVASQLSAPPIACAYPLSADVTPAGFAQLALSNSDQTGSFVIPSGAMTTKAAAPDGFLTGTSQQIDASTGVVGVGYVPDALPLTTGTDVVGMGLFFRDPGTLAVVGAINLYSNNGTYYVDSFADGSLAQEVDVGTTKPDMLYVAFDSANSQIRFWYEIASVQTEMTAQAYTPAQVFPDLQADSSVTGAHVGQTVSGTFVSAASGMPNFPLAGAVDACGNAIG